MNAVSQSRLAEGHEFIKDETLTGIFRTANDVPNDQALAEKRQRCDWNIVLQTHLIATAGYSATKIFDQPPQ
jgi:hypothetical protein